MNPELIDAYEKAKDEYQRLLDESKGILSAVDELVESNRTNPDNPDNMMFREKLSVLRSKASENCEKFLAARKAYEDAAEALVEND